MNATAPITIEGETLTDAEQRLLMIVHCLHSSGMVPSFADEGEEGNRAVAEWLCARKILARADEPCELMEQDDGAGYYIADREPEEKPCGTGQMLPAGYYFATKRAAWIAEVVFDSSGLEFGDLV